VVRVKVSRGIETFSPIGIDSADTIVNCPIGRFAWTNHIYFQITQPGSSYTSVPRYRGAPISTGEKNGKTLWKTMEMTWGKKNNAVIEKAGKRKSN
jgi:hypothetical protein